MTGRRGEKPEEQAQSDELNVNRTNEVESKKPVVPVRSAMYLSRVLTDLGPNRNPHVEILGAWLTPMGAQGSGPKKQP